MPDQLYTQIIPVGSSGLPGATLLIHLPFQNISDLNNNFNVSIGSPAGVPGIGGSGALQGLTTGSITNQANYTLQFKPGIIPNTVRNWAACMTVCNCNGFSQDCIDFYPFWGTNNNLKIWMRDTFNQDYGGTQDATGASQPGSNGPSAPFPHYFIGGSHWGPVPAGASGGFIWSQVLAANPIGKPWNDASYIPANSNTTGNAQNINGQVAVNTFLPLIKLMTGQNSAPTIIKDLYIWSLDTIVLG